MAWMQSGAKLISVFVSDTAKEVHKNTTKEAMNILRYLTDREKRMEQSYEDSKSIVTVGSPQRHLSVHGIINHNSSHYRVFESRCWRLLQLLTSHLLLCPVR